MIVVPKLGTGGAHIYFQHSQGRGRQISQSWRQARSTITIKNFKNFWRYTEKPCTEKRKKKKGKGKSEKQTNPSSSKITKLLRLGTTKKCIASCHAY